MRRLPCFFVVFAAALLSTAPSAQSPGREEVAAGAGRVFDRIAKAYVAPGPGCAVAVSLNGDTVFEKAFGLAEIEHNVPNTPQTIFESGSVAKQFTAAALVLLQEEGKLGCEDPVQKYIPELPDSSGRLSLGHWSNPTSVVH